MISACLILAGPAPAAPVRTESDLHAALAQARPGETVILGNSVWRDLVIRWTASGTAARPITLRAEEPGKVILSGASSIALGGDHLVVQGLVFRDGFSPDAAPIEFMVDEAHVANHSRVTECAIDHWNPADRFQGSEWVVLFGKNNRVDHCTFAGKLNSAPTLIVELNDERHRDNFHRIDHNLFGSRPRLGSNGGETIRVGVSAFCTMSSRTIIEQNVFQRCSGEVEVVSIKSSDNIIRNNVFLECEGVLALRHGDRNLVEGNFFLGNNRPNSGGIRVVNESHVVRNNHLQELRGRRFFGTLAVMNGVPDSLPNRYMPVLDVLFSGNRFFDCGDIEFGVGRDNERTVAPDRCRFEDNLVVGPAARAPFVAIDSVAGVTFTGNRALLGGGSVAAEGFSTASASYAKRADGLYAGGDYQPRLPVTVRECGAPWYTPLPEGGRAAAPGRVVAVPAGLNTVAEAVEASAPGDILELVAGGDYPVERTLVLRHPLTLRTTPAESGARATLRVINNKAERPIVQLDNGGSLTARGLRFDGASTSGVAQAGITTWRKAMIDHLNVIISDCDFVNFDSARYSAFVMRKSTFADTVSFTNCRFEDISGTAISLQAEYEDGARYSAEQVILRNCLFRNVMGAALDLYRGGNDESTTGPMLRVSHCTFINVNNVELGSVLRLTGVQDGDVRDCLFVDSGRSGRAVKMEDQRWCALLVSHCNLTRSGRIESFYPDRRGPGITELETEFAGVGRGDFSLAPDSPLAGGASDARDLGALWSAGLLRD